MSSYKRMKPGDCAWNPGRPFSVSLSYYNLKQHSKRMVRPMNNTMIYFDFLSKVASHQKVATWGLCGQGEAVTRDHLPLIV